MSHFKKLPQHIAIAMDGNGRWAQLKGMPRMKGHQKGSNVVRMLCELCLKWNIPYLTLWAFSTENWRRPQDEVSFLMALLKRVLKRELPSLLENNIRLRVIGNRHRLSPTLISLIDEAIFMTKENDSLHLTIALDYGGRDDITQALRTLGDKIKHQQLSPEDITEDIIQEHLLTHDLPDPDLFIRPGGVSRISNYLIWQLAYAELFFTQTLWPDFSESDLLEALTFFEKVQRRFGGLEHA